MSYYVAVCSPSEHAQSHVLSQCFRFEILMMQTRLTCLDVHTSALELAEREFPQFLAVQDLQQCLWQVFQISMKKKYVERLEKFHADYVKAMQVAKPSELCALKVLKGRFIADAKCRYAQEPLAKSSPSKTF